MEIQEKNITRTKVTFVVGCLLVLLIGALKFIQNLGVL
jgi:hypothetical protein